MDEIERAEEHCSLAGAANFVHEDPGDRPADQEPGDNGDRGVCAAVRLCGDSEADTRRDDSDKEARSDGSRQVRPVVVDIRAEVLRRQAVANHEQRLRQQRQHSERGREGSELRQGIIPPQERARKVERERPLAHVAAGYLWSDGRTEESNRHFDEREVTLWGNDVDVIGNYCRYCELSGRRDEGDYRDYHRDYLRRCPAAEAEGATKGIEVERDDCVAPLESGPLVVTVAKVVDAARARFSFLHQRSPWLL